MALKDKIAEAFGMGGSPKGEEEAPRDGSGRLKLRTAQQAKGGMIASGVNEVAQGFGNMGIRAGMNYLTQATGNPGYAMSSEDIINGLDNYANEVHYQSFLNREGKWIQQEMEDISTESRNMMKTYSVRTDQNGNPLDPGQPVEEGMQVEESNVLYNAESGKPFDPLDKSTWIPMSEGQNVVNRSNATYHRKMIGLLQQVNQVGMTWYSTNPQVAQLVGQMTGSYIESLNSMFSGQQQVRKTDAEVAGMEATTASVEQRTAQAEQEAAAPGNLAAGILGGGGGAPQGAPQGAPPQGPGGGPAPYTSLRQGGQPSPADQAGAAVSQSAQQTPGTQEHNASITALPTQPTDDEIMAAKTIFEQGENASPQNRQAAEAVLGRTKAVTARNEQIKGNTTAIMERQINQTWPGSGGLAGVIRMQAEEQRKVAEYANANQVYVPKTAVSPEMLDYLRQDAENLAQKHVRRQEVAGRLEQVNPEFADMGPVAREQYLNDFLKDADAAGDPNAASMIYTGGIQDEMERLGIKHTNIMNQEIEKHTAEAWKDAATRIASDPEGFSAEVSQLGGATTTYDTPLEDHLANPAMKYAKAEGAADPRMHWGSDWIETGVATVEEFPMGSPERKAAGQWWIRQTDRNLQAAAEAKQDEIDQFTADAQTGEMVGNTPAQNSPIGKKKAVSDVAELLLDQDLAEQMESTPGHVPKAFHWLGGMIDRMVGEETGSIQALATEILGSEQAFGAFAAAFEKKHGVALEIPAQEIYDMLSRHGWSADDLDATREAEEARVYELETQKNQVLEARNEVVESWGRVSDITMIGVVQDAMNPAPQAAPVQ